MIQPTEILKVLETAPLFRSVPSELLARNLNQSGIRILKSGEILLISGQANNMVYIILSGYLSVQLKESDVEPIAMLSEGECVGEMSILGNSSVSAYVIAATDCELLAIDHQTLWDMIDRSHAAAHNMLSILSKRIRLTDQLMEERLGLRHGFSGTPIVEGLTGLYSRRWMHEKFEHCLQRSTADNKPGCLMMLEMDRFKEFSDSHGQLGSDQALRNIAHTMLSSLRPEDQAGHYLGEKFDVFLSNTSLFNACLAAEKLRETVSRSVVVLPSGDVLPPISISLGISEARPSDMLVSLSARADEALRLARESGGNCVKCVK